MESPLPTPPNVAEFKATWMTALAASRGAKVKQVTRDVVVHAIAHFHDHAREPASDDIPEFCTHVPERYAEDVLRRVKAHMEPHGWTVKSRGGFDGRQICVSLPA